MSLQLSISRSAGRGIDYAITMNFGRKSAMKSSLVSYGRKYGGLTSSWVRCEFAIYLCCMKYRTICDHIVLWIAFNACAFSNSSWRRFAMQCILKPKLGSIGSYKIISTFVPLIHLIAVQFVWWIFVFALLARESLAIWDIAELWFLNDIFSNGFDQHLVTGLFNTLIF